MSIKVVRNTVDIDGEYYAVRITKGFGGCYEVTLHGDDVTFRETYPMPNEDSEKYIKLIKKAVNDFKGGNDKKAFDELQKWDCKIETENVGNDENELKIHIKPELVGVEEVEQAIEQLKSKLNNLRVDYNL